MPTFMVRDAANTIITARNLTAAAMEYFSIDMDNHITTFHRAKIGRWDRRRSPDTIEFREVYIVATPKEPKCSRKGGHRWEDGQIYASGPSVAHTDTCLRCGMRRRVDGNGQNPEDGTQGHRIVEYLDAK